MLLVIAEVAMLAAPSLSPGRCGCLTSGSMRMFEARFIKFSSPQLDLAPAVHLL
jgi:hypothetical protein